MTDISRNFEFTIHFQRTLLHRILSDKKFAAASVSILSVDLFDSVSLKWIVLKILEGFTSLRILAAELKNNSQLDLELRKSIKSDILSFAQPVEIQESDYALEQLREFAHKQKISAAMIKAAEKINEGGHSSHVREIIGQAIFQTGEQKAITLDPIATYRERFEERDRMAKAGDIVFVSSGFKNIDDDIKGPMLGQMWVYFGDTNVGKSQAAVGVGSANILRGFRTLHFNLEDQMDVTIQRYDSRFTKILYEKLTNSDLTSTEKETIERVYELLKSRRNNFLHVSKLEEDATIQELNAEYKRIQLTHNFKPDVVVLDSPHDMDPLKRSENFRLGQRQLYRELRNFCRRERVALIGFDQSNQESKGKVADTSAASESYAKARIVDGFITMNQTKLQKKDGLIELFTAKMKDRPKHRSYMVRPNFASCRFISIEREGARAV